MNGEHHAEVDVCLGGIRQYIGAFMTAIGEEGGDESGGVAGVLGGTTESNFKLATDLGEVGTYSAVHDAEFFLQHPGIGSKDDTAFPE
jgi:hypothetical protein